VVKNGKTTTEYRWGGTSCSNKTLPEELVALLYEAFRARKNTHITPRFQNGQGSNKCLVGFTLAENESKKSKGDDDNAPE
jgi:hypothetical protein